MRRLVGALAAAGVVVGLAGTVVSLATDAPPTPAQVSYDEVLAAEPHLAVDCLPCDRVRLDIALLRPARTVRATIAGRPLELRGSGTTFSGRLARAGIRTRMHVTPPSGELWYGIDPPAPLVTLRIGYPGGRVEETWIEVRLRAASARSS